MNFRLFVFGSVLILGMIGCGDDASRRSGPIHGRGVGVLLDLKNPSSTLTSPDGRWKLSKVQFDGNTFYLALINNSNGSVYPSTLIHEDKYKADGNTTIYWNTNNDLVFETDSDTTEVWHLNQTEVLDESVVRYSTE